MCLHKASERKRRKGKIEVSQRAKGEGKGEKGWDGRNQVLLACASLSKKGMRVCMHTHTHTHAHMHTHTFSHWVEVSLSPSASLDLTIRIAPS